MPIREVALSLERLILDATIDVALLAQYPVEAVVIILNSLACCLLRLRFFDSYRQHDVLQARRQDIAGNYFVFLCGFYVLALSYQLLQQASPLPYVFRLIPPLFCLDSHNPTNHASASAIGSI